MKHPRHTASEYPAEFDAYRGRILSLAFTDDHVCSWPPSQSIDRFLYTLPMVTATRIQVDPVALGLTQEVGHVMAFKPVHKEKLWPALAAWIRDGVIVPELKGERWDTAIDMWKVGRQISKLGRKYTESKL